MNSPRGSGSLRQRRPGVWEVRVALGADPISGHCRQRSVTVRGDSAEAAEQLARWAAVATLVRVARRADPAVSLARLLETWLGTDHGWRPSTVAGYRSVVGFLVADPLGRRRASTLTPALVRLACTGWLRGGAGEATVWARVRVLRSALGWAYTERILDSCPLDVMRGPPQPRTRSHVPVEQVVALLGYAEGAVGVQRDLLAVDVGAGRAGADLHRAEQVLLLCRLAADTGARRGELAALQLADLDGRVLTIERAASGEVIGPTKTGRVRRLTLGPTSSDLWQTSVEKWMARSGSGGFGPWLFSTDLRHGTRLTTCGLGHWFAQLCAAAGMPEVTLHRLRHSVATALVSRGQILQAQYRLGHADAHTTLRIYAHAQPLHDLDAADTLDELYRT
ncbi:MAG TPA: tyrosine-type recombinase/integrase [Dermatophilaceae bacterium]